MYEHDVTIVVNMLCIDAKVSFFFLLALHVHVNYKIEMAPWHGICKWDIYRQRKKSDASLNFNVQCDYGDNGCDGDNDFEPNDDNNNDNDDDDDDADGDDEDDDDDDDGDDDDDDEEEEEEKRRRRTSRRKYVRLQWNLSWETTAMRDHLSWKTRHSWQKNLHLNITEPVTRATCLERPHFYGQLGGLSRQVLLYWQFVFK